MLVILKLWKHIFLFLPLHWTGKKCSWRYFCLQIQLYEITNPNNFIHKTICITFFRSEKKIKKFTVHVKTYTKWMLHNVRKFEKIGWVYCHCFMPWTSIDTEIRSFFCSDTIFFEPLSKYCKFNVYIIPHVIINIHSWIAPETHCLATRQQD